MPAHCISIDRSVPVHEGAANGHNRWHPDLAPVASVEPGAEVTFELRDSRDRRLSRASSHEDLLGTPAIAHPLTGPLEVAGADPGDVLEVEVLAYETDDFGWTAIWPGSGFLGDLFDRPFLARWDLDGTHARSEQIPGVAVPACVHAGTIGVAPSWELLERARAREAAIGTANPPSPELAWPPSAADGLRTYPPRENGGNMDIRDLGPGARLWLPVHTPGALLSVGDLHFAQGDGEVCISAIETGGSGTFRLHVRRDGWRPAFPCYEAPPRPPRAVFATTGIPLTDSGAQGDLDLNLATRRALVELLGWLGAERGLGPEAAYVLISVAAELRISQLVDAPNALVSAALPLDVFEAP
jgi:formamidase